ncbi:ABC transporter permease [Puia sp.]|jgi:ABC-type antimicrobial peptide transport system permease subunit|uniref:ABC transporter permease n=1 Tax=Puia sp. TaxID=2045100 RepID=UPI002F413039
MLKNYFRTAWRSLMRGRSFSIINISGLVVGMAGATMILLWLANEVSFDQFHVNKDRIYQIYSMTDIPGEKHSTIGVVSQPIGPALEKEVPEVEAVTRVRDVTSFLLTTNGKSFTGMQGEFVDPAFLDIFTFPLTQGNKKDQLNNVYSITITENMALKLFGTRDAMGKDIRIDSVDHFTVTGILKDIPANTIFYGVDYLLPIAYMKKLGWNYDNWISNNIFTAVLLKPNASLTAFNDKIRNFTRIKTGRNDIWMHFAYPLSQWHLHSKFDDGKPVGGRIDTVRTFGVIAAFILLIACINFMNLSTARSEQRAKEVGIRKVAGAGRGLLIGQFIIEALLTSSIAGVIAFLVAAMVLPFFSTLVGTPLSLPLDNVTFWLYAFGFIVLTSLLAGSYPAFYLSSFRPVGIFRKQFRKAQSLFAPRKVLVVLQFTFAVVLIISTLIVRRQIQYAEDRDLGYSKNNLVYVNLVGDIEKNYAPIKQELLNMGIATSVSKTWTPMTEGGGHTWSFRWPGHTPQDTNTTITIFAEDGGLVKTAGMKLVAGRDIDVERYPADSLGVLLNETAVKVMGYKDPVGQLLPEPYFKRNWHIVGVVKDYVDASPYERIPPIVIEGPAAALRTMHIRFNPGRSTAVSLAGAERIFKKYNPAYPFDYSFVDAEYARKFGDEQRTKTMAGLFAGLAIFISCLGLFGLSAYVAESRIKEIGVRKVLGASVSGIARLLSINFVQLVLIAIVIATPVAWYGMNKWLEAYTYHITVGWGVFVLAGLLAMVIALMTVSFQAVRAARANPVRSLRSE